MIVKQYHLILTWAYLVELLLVGLVYGIMLATVGQQHLVGIVQENWSVFSAISGGLCAAGVALLIYVLQLSDSEFWNYLAWRKAEVHYLRAYQIQTLLFALAAIMPMAAGLGGSAWAGHATWIIFLYACVNIITVVRNTIDMVRLRQKFRSEHNAIVAAIITNPEPDITEPPKQKS